MPVAFGGADTACAAYGAGLAKPGMAQLSTGTGGQIVVTLDRPVADPTRRSHLFRAVHDGGWYAMAALQNVGLALERAWRLLGVTWSEAYELAATAPPGSAAVTFVPHLSGERTPYLDTTLRGGWLGLGLGTERHHLVRATFEGVAFGLRQALDTLREAGHVPPALALAGGGSQHPFWRQMLADILGVRLIAHAHPAASARGAAALAAQAVGLIAEPPQPESTKADDITEPTNADCYAEAYDAFRRRSPLR